MDQQIHISVRSLVEYVYRSGSIDTGLKTATSMHEGTRLHQEIQNEYKEDDQKEVYLKTNIDFDGITYTVDGRCDGLLKEGEATIIDEIKSTSLNISDLDHNHSPVHWAQAKFYAFMYLLKHAQEDITIQLTYIQKQSKEKKRFKETVSLSELRPYIEWIIHEYSAYAKLMLEHKKKRNESIQALPFPFPEFRKGQRKLAGAVYKTIQDKTNLFANAPTGTGKTISTLFPSVKAIGEGYLEQIYYLTAKTTTRQTAEETFSLMDREGLSMHTVSITAKDKICFKEETICQKDYCEFANGYYDRINGAILDLFQHETNINREVIESYARKHQVCPFEFSLDASYQADAIICDYNYIFDPRVSLKRMWNESKAKTALLIDEAHNLVDRSRSMFSAELLKSEFLDLKRIYKSQNQDLFESAKAINDRMLQMKKEMMENETEKKSDHKPSSLIELVEQFNESAEKELVQSEQSVEQDKLLEAYFNTLSFMRIAKLYDSSFITYLQRYKSEVRVKLFCVDPSGLLQKMSKGYRALTYFSATLMPMPYFQTMLGWKDEDYRLSIPSPFPVENSEVYVKPTSTRYRDREQSIEPIIQTIAEFTHKAGNYLVFFPSYQYMNEVYEAFSMKYEHVDTILQETQMNDTEREAFLARFQKGCEQPLVGFAVLGGVFSEGVDLKGDRLNGVLIIGTGMPKLNDERDIIKDYFQENSGQGFNYAYVYPGMNKVLQAGGRLIRTETDKGFIVLIDDRFLQPKYQTLLPPEWRNFKVLPKY